jgi:hypothetical protein
MAPSRAVTSLAASFSPLRIRSHGPSSQRFSLPHRSFTSRSISHRPSYPSSPSLPRYANQHSRIRHSAISPSYRQQPSSSLASWRLTNTHGILLTRQYSQFHQYGTGAAAYTHDSVSSTAFRVPSSDLQMQARGWRSPALKRTLPPRDICRRAYSSAQEAVKEKGATANGPEAPDFLDEKERAVFDILKAELAPTELEVRTSGA